MGKQQVVTPPERDPYVMRALEPRIVLDAAAVETAMDASHQALDLNGSSQPEPTPVETTNPYQILEEKLATPDIVDEPPLRNEVIFIAADVPDIDDLVQGLPQGLEVILLDGERDGIDQIADALFERSDISAIHLISHGRQGALTLGDVELNSDTMSQTYASQLAVIGQALTVDGDLLGPVEIHRVRIIVAPMWIMASKLVSVLQARKAIRLNSFSFPK